VDRAPKDAAPRAAPRRARRALRVALLALLVAATVVAGGEWLLRQSFFRVQHATVLGATHETSAAVLAASGLDARPALIDLSAREIDARLAVFPWVAGVTIEKHWPDSVVVHVRERTAVAVAFNSRHALRYVDAGGHDLGAAPLAANLPTLHYDGPATTWPFEAAGRGAADVAARLPAAFAAQVSVVSVDAHGNVGLQLTTPVRFILGPPTDLHAKFVAIASVIAHSTLRPGDVVDVTVPGALAVTGPAPS
jgi:cell division protein FtsQ